MPRTMASSFQRQEELSTLSVDHLVSLIEPRSHAVQTGVLFRLERDPTSGTMKHLRTGVDTSKAEHGGFARLLIRKGIITEAEYFAAIVEGLEYENEINEAWANAALGTTDIIRFG